MAQKSWEEGEIGGKSREEGDLLTCSSPLTLEGIEEIKTAEKMTSKEFEEYLFHQRCKKTATVNTVIGLNKFCR